MTFHKNTKNFGYETSIRSIDLTEIFSKAESIFVSKNGIIVVLFPRHNSGILRVND